MSRFNYNELESPILPAKFLENKSTGSGEDFRRVFTINGHGGHLSNVTQMPPTNFRSHIPKEAPASNLALIDQAVLEKICENVN